jgi:hypothetical protein
MICRSIPYASEQGIFCCLQGIKSGVQGILRPDQGKRPMAHVLPGAGGAKARCAIGVVGSYPSTPLAETPRPSHRR